MTIFSLFLLLQIIAALALITIGIIRSRTGIAFVFVTIAALFIAVSITLGTTLPQFTSTIDAVAIGLSSLALCFGFIKVCAPTKKKAEQGA